MCHGLGSVIAQQLLYQKLMHIQREAMEIFDLDREHPLEVAIQFTGRPGVGDSEMARAHGTVCTPSVPDKHLPRHPAIAVEIADTVIRLLDLGAWLRLDVGQALVDKMTFNESRPVLHGKRH
ncbi:MAG: hypothetical protein L0312_24095 [Acidobacteria bacterium]|nr:hypothetical protein [Acidobacteriota bacterium]